MSYKVSYTKKTQKTQKRDRSPSPAVSERSTESAQTTIEIHEQPTTKEPEGPDAEAAEPHVRQDGIGDTHIPPTQSDQMKKHIKSTSVILSDEDEACVVEWLADHPLMYNKKIEEYKETDKKEKLWEELGEELGFTSRHKLIFYLLLLVLSQ